MNCPFCNCPTDARASFCPNCGAYLGTQGIINQEKKVNKQGTLSSSIFILLGLAIGLIIPFLGLIGCGIGYSLAVPIKYRTGKQLGMLGIICCASIFILSIVLSILQPQA